MSQLLYKNESYEIIGACFEVYKEKGCGFTEPVYQECLALELEMRGISFIAQPKLKLMYKNRPLEQSFRPDFVIDGKIIVEIKSVERLADPHRSQTLNYLNATGSTSPF